MNFKRFPILMASAMLLLAADVNAQKVSIMHTNDTHSQIDPTENNLGGVMRRKALIDSIRNDYGGNSLLIDAGDVVQGTLYFNLFKGKTEREVMNHLGYDYAILGNHEFDNGMDSLANFIAANNAKYLTSNYDLSKTALRDMFAPYAVENFGDKRVGFLAINIPPKGLISDRNAIGVEYRDMYNAVESVAWLLREVEGVDKVVAITHIGYSNDKDTIPGDYELALNTAGIDAIIGGHSHTRIFPNSGNDSIPFLVNNREGKPVFIAQTGSRGEFLGEMIIDFDCDTIYDSLIPVDARLDSYHDATLESIVSHYKAPVDSLLHLYVSQTDKDLDTQAMANLFADLVKRRGAELVADGVIDLGLINNGGIRNPILKGKISKGQIMMTLPFTNTIAVVELTGRQLEEMFNQMLIRNITGVSGNVDVTLATDGRSCSKVLIDGKPIDPDRIYRLATIDYLADGGDRLEVLRSTNHIALSPNLLYDDMADMLAKIKKVKADSRPRVHN